LVALDGNEANYLRFCKEWQIPLVYADAREGVGLSKNRVLERYPDFDYYFFVEDDVELVDGRVFPTHVDMFLASGIHHFSLFERGGLRNIVSSSLVIGRRVVHGSFGGAHFNFFTREGLHRVGGWHPTFARYQRWGHTEHSQRFVINGLAPAAFNVAEELADAMIWHYPPAVTRLENVPVDRDQIALPEREIMELALRHVPLQTLSPHHVNGVPLGPPDRLAATLEGGERYPIAEPWERRRCWSEYHLWRHQKFGGLGALLRAASYWPWNPGLRRILRRPS
jgi:hypothetical protein